MKRDHLDGDAPFFFVWKIVFLLLFYLASFSFWPYDIVSSSFIRFVLLFVVVVVVSRLITLDKPIGMYTNERDSFKSVMEMKMYRMKEQKLKCSRNETSSKLTEKIWWDVIICGEETANQYNSRWWWFIKAKEECETKKKISAKDIKRMKNVIKRSQDEPTLLSLTSESHWFLKQEKKKTPYVFPLHINICEMLGLKSKTDAAER